MMSACKTLHCLLIAALALARSTNVDASLSLIPMIRSNSNGISDNSDDAIVHTNAHHRETSEKDLAAEELLQALPAAESAFGSSQRENAATLEEEYSLNDAIRDMALSNGREESRDSSSEDLMIPYSRAQRTGNRLAKIAEDGVLLDLLAQLVKYRLVKQQQLLRQVQHQEQEREHQAEPRAMLGKRLWGQRRNIQTRFASFGTKLTPSRKMLLGGSGSTLLRYGRSSGQRQ